METLDTTILRAGSLWENHHGVTLLHLLLQTVHHLFRIRNGEEIGITDHDTIERIMPHPVLRQDDQFGCQHDDTHQVEVRLMVTDNHRRLLEGLVVGITI